MSLVPYSPNDSRSVVLRHRQTLVVFDPESRQLVLHEESPSTSRPETIGFQSCPFCKRPLHDGADNGGGVSQEHAPPSLGHADVMTDSGFVDRDYFRMLDARYIGLAPIPIAGVITKQARRHSILTNGVGGVASPRRPPPSPTRRRLPRPEVEDVGEGFNHHAEETEDEVSGHGISSAAFSPGYFQRFFVAEGELGRGGKGVVLLVKHVLDSVPLGHFACKRVPVGDNHKWLKKVLVEVQLLQQLSHTNLVSYRHVWLENVQLTTFGPSVPCAFILQQYCNAGDLHNYVLRSAKKTTTEQLKEKIRRRTRGQADLAEDSYAPRRLAFEQIISFFRDIASGLNHLHSNGFIHRDLKPSNCLLNDTGIPGQELRVLVSDFGEVQIESEKRKSTGATGTISYCAPEVLRRIVPGGQFANFTTKSDVFSLGMILHFMCFGNLPYAGVDLLNEENENLDTLRDEILAYKGLDGRTRLRSDLPERLYQSLEALISPDPNIRPSAEEILLGLGVGIIGEEPPLRRGSAGSQKKPVVLDDQNTVGFRRISPVADTPPPSTPVGSPANSLNYDYEAFKQPSRSYFPTSSRALRRGSLDPAKRGSKLSAGPIFPPGESIANGDSVRGDRTFDPESSIILRPRMDPITTVRALPPLTWKGRVVMYATRPEWVTAGRLVVFLVKAISLTGPCSPAAVKPWVYYPLLSLAALDFTGPGLNFTFLLGFLHVVVLLLVNRLGSVCQSIF